MINPHPAYIAGCRFLHWSRWMDQWWWGARIYRPNYGPERALVVCIGRLLIGVRIR